jgi:putative heme iron utilization protein
MSDDEPKTLRDTDDAARQLARELVLTARFGAIAVIDPQTGYPNSSRVLTATDGGGNPVILASRLAAHTKALLASPRCSLLIGEPGKGDPLAWPRISLQCDAEQIGSAHPEREHLRTRFLRRHPKASLYIDFPDFMFFRLVPVAASLNGGFGKAYALTPDDLGLADGEPLLSLEDENRLVERAESSDRKPAGYRLAAVTSSCLIYEAKDKKKVVQISQIIEK